MSYIDYTPKIKEHFFITIKLSKKKFKLMNCTYNRLQISIMMVLILFSTIAVANAIESTSEAPIHCRIVSLLRLSGTVSSRPSIPKNSIF